MIARTNIGPFSLRAWSMTTQEAIEALALEKLSVPRQALAVACIQNMEPREVRESIERGTLLAEIETFSDSFPLALVRPVVEWCGAQTKAIDEARVDVVPQHPPDSRAPGN
jgi:hypothetical protein